jgi:hypothetical protein
MDILTPRGQGSRADELLAVNIFLKHYPDFKYIETPKDSPAIIDAILVKNGEMYSAVETKCRDMSLEQFTGSFESKWLMTYEKISKARQMAFDLGIGLTGFLYLKRSNILLVSKISCRSGLYQKKILIEATETQKTINGGKIIRNNAYIDMSDAARLEG